MILPRVHCHCSAASGEARPAPAAPSLCAKGTSTTRRRRPLGVRNAKKAASRKETVKVPTYKYVRCGRSYRVRQFLSHPSGVESMLNARAMESYQLIDSRFSISQLPMAQPSNMSTSPPPPSLAQVMVVSPLYCAPFPVDLSIVRNIMIFANGRFDITDLSNNIVFKVRESVFSWRYRLILLDATGNPLLTLQKKIISAHDRWKVYRGESSDEKDLLFSVERSSMIQLLRTKLHVFLANNTSEDRCDFRVERSWLQRSCVIYAGDSNSVVAQMQRKLKFFGNDSFMVSVFPNVDAAFVAAVIVILDEINSSSSRSSSIRAKSTAAAHHRHSGRNQATGFCGGVVPT